MLAPKAAGARCLDRVTADDPLDLFVLFSSAAALVGAGVPAPVLRQGSRPRLGFPPVTHPPAPPLRG
ncbi:KR domain-containing protein [Streptomyces sp. NPDC052114]|uniref:KR domain-containing protein n=1 Tax=Streptomyces sp. NPDC052114 TaxID=3155528 RepID=UPI00341E853D